MKNASHFSNPAVRESNSPDAEQGKTSTKSKTDQQPKEKTVKEFSKKTISETEQIAVDGRDLDGQGNVGEVSHAYVENFDRFGTPDYFLVAMVRVEEPEKTEFDVMIQRDGKQFTARVRRGGPGSLDWKNLTRPARQGGAWAVRTHFTSIRQAVECAICNPHFSG